MVCFFYLSQPVAQLVKDRVYGSPFGKLFILVVLLFNQLCSDLPRRQFDVQTGCSQRGVHVSSGLHGVTDIIEQIWQVFLGAFAPSQAECVLALQT
jgi:hypothetical protein